jgi:hypothetical protein
MAPLLQEICHEILAQEYLAAIGVPISGKTPQSHYLALIVD